ncbi:MAG TPA: hypothetical protein VL240_05700 [Candidatus Binatia bacterium]|nr:hypothetical protein [Candidatus Binatia bacterium]
MRNSFWCKTGFWVAICLLIGATAFAADSNSNPAAEPTTAAAAAAPAAGPGSTLNPTLVDLLVKKGILTSAEASSLRNASGSAGMEQLLLLLKAKGVVTDTEAAEVKDATAENETMHSLIDTESGGVTSANLTTPQAAKPAESKGPTVVPAIAPVRVLPLNPPVKDGLGPSIKLGSGAMISPYGFIKSTAAYDSSSPRGDDFPPPGFLNADTGPNKNPEFHLKARATRFGTKFEWPEVSKNITITGQVEADFEGNFSRVDNRNVSSIRSNAFQLRLAFGRIDWTMAPNTDIFFEAGQDWSIYGSSALMNLLETTFFGAYWGNTYERTPQFRVGFVQKLGGSRDWKISPEFAIAMPSEGDLPADSVSCTVTALGTPTTCTVVDGLANQLGYGERQGADAASPELESRLVLQFQLDKAPGVVPAQILWSGFYTTRQATLLASAIPNCTGCATGAATFKDAFRTGVDLRSHGYGNQVAVSLPTRWATVVASGYMGADLRWFFADQLNSYYNQAHGLLHTANGFSVDNNPAVFGVNAAGVPTVAPQLPVRGYGGFIQLGLPISRWFNANPKGRNAGWQVYGEWGLDASNANDFRIAKNISATAGAGPIRSHVGAVTVFYKMNPWVQFGFEESNYTSQALPDTHGVCTTKVAGRPTCNWTDIRSEFGPIFTF